MHSHENGRSEKVSRVLVLGAGVIGMSTAVCVQDLGPSVQVTLMSESFSPNTTSDAAGGIWSPYSLGRTDPGFIRKISKDTYDHLMNIAFSQDAGDAGVQQLSGYRLYDYDFEPDEEYPFRDVVENYVKLKKEDLERFPIAKSGYFVTTLQVEGPKYLAWLMKRFKAKGGNAIQRKVKQLSEVSEDWDVVVNCCGIGARDLLGDTDLHPIRGQLLRVEAPWVKHFYMFMPRKGHDYAYIIPSSNYVILGSTYEVNNDSTEIMEEDRDLIWQSALEHLPRLQGARHLSSCVGVRPVRSEIRIETEVIECSGGSIQMVHNYGHGGSGVTIHWGCSLMATDLVKKFLNKKKSQTTSVSPTVKQCQEPSC